ncbi:hypothetical protein C8N36_106144 [Pelagimonas varians]|uniref:Uncharacterized protein n=1 Tax=Pelagimonas varians TaxID=696760 RepID=A0A238K577_9RHOB|nr:hypothetical protein C8N36_106144 [Pelagimonas varians]SMX37627.1 hypothetical protein PEV8663_01146 [Pelagimonas varians]
MSAQFFVEEPCQDVFPRRMLEGSDHVDVPFVANTDSNTKEEISLEWDDPSGTGNSKQVELSF